MTEHLLTRDHIAKRLEVEAIARHVKDGMTVLDVGCGDGETLCELAARYAIQGIGYDSSEVMLGLAFARWAQVGMDDAKGTVGMFLGDALRMVVPNCDLIYSERVLICLPDWETQKRAIANIARCLKPGGLYVMCECSQDGLDAVNAMRDCVGLPPVVPPSWDRYLRDDEVEAFAHPKVDEPSADGSHWTLSLPSARCGLTLEGIERFGSTYAFLSRVVNAFLTAKAGCEPEYDSEINKLALKLPPIGDFGQYTIWKWRKR